MNLRYGVDILFLCALASTSLGKSQPSIQSRMVRDMLYKKQGPWLNTVLKEPHGLNRHNPGVETEDLIKFFDAGTPQDLLGNDYGLDKREMLSLGKKDNGWFTDEQDVSEEASDMDVNAAIRKRAPITCEQLCTKCTAFFGNQVQPCQKQCNLRRGKIYIFCVTVSAL